MSDRTALSWIEIDERALRHNLSALRRLAGPERELMVVVKADAYGHGMLPVARIALDSGAAWLAVFDVAEALALRAAGIAAPILVFGPTPRNLIRSAAEAGIALTIASPHAVDDVAAAAPAALRVHLKLECGTNRQGFLAEEFEHIVRLAGLPGVVVEGAYSHFADIEDTTDHTFAMQQLRSFEERVAQLGRQGVVPARLHTACTAATLLFPETYFDLVRVGIGAYGLWPSKETLVSVKQSGREPVALQPVMTWKTRIAQVKTLPAGVTVGYGRTYKTTRPTLLAVLPVGYANGYDRGLSNRAHALVRGQRAKVVGRVMMNMTTIDVTDVGGAAAGDEVVLLGSQGDERISAETMASWLDTINYEVVARAEPHGPRVVV
ncbi:MAG: alanine racemase [Deltaproteobacteria bacterium]|nr:alanine racemase [Deltaproteobacteria bacterium]